MNEEPKRLETLTDLMTPIFGVGLGETLGAIKQQLTQHEKRFDAIDRRFDIVDAHLRELDAKIDAVYAKLADKIDAGDAKLDAKIDAVYAKLTERTDALDVRVDQLYRAIIRMDERMKAVEAKLETTSRAVWGILAAVVGGFLLQYFK